MVLTAKAQIFLSNHGLYGLYGFLILIQTKTLKTPLSLSVAFGLRTDLMPLRLKASFRARPKLIPVAYRNTASAIGKNTALRAEKGADFKGAGFKHSQSSGLSRYR